GFKQLAKEFSMSKALYNAKALSTGGGRDGHVATADRQIDLDVRPPQELGGSGEGTNPEQLVAAGWAACFNGALQKQMKDNDVDLSKSPEVLVSAPSTPSTRDSASPRASRPPSLAWSRHRPTSSCRQLTPSARTPRQCAATPT